MDQVQQAKSLLAVNLRWLGILRAKGEYLPSLSINYAAINKDLEKSLPQLYYENLLWSALQTSELS